MKQFGSLCGGESGKEDGRWTAKCHPVTEDAGVASGQPEGRKLQSLGTVILTTGAVTETPGGE